MDTLTTTIIAAVAAIVAAIITAWATIRASAKKTDSKLDIHEVKSDGRQEKLSGEHTQLLTGQNSLSNELSLIRGTVFYLKGERLKDEARRESMKGQMLDTQKALDILNASLSQMAELNTKLSEAQKEIATLQKENADLRRENATLHQELDQSIDREDEGEIER